MMLGPRRRWWMLRAIVLFGGVYVLGLTGVPTLVPYLIALIAVVSDAFRTAKTAKNAKTRTPSKAAKKNLYE